MSKGNCYKGFLEEVREEYYEYLQNMEYNQYSTLRRLFEVLSESSLELVSKVNIDDEGYIYLDDVKVFHIEEEFGIFSICDGFKVLLKEGNVIGNLQLIVVYQGDGVGQIYKQWLDGSHEDIMIYDTTN